MPATRYNSPLRGERQPLARPVVEPVMLLQAGNSN